MERTGEERLTIVCSLILLSISNWLRPVRYGRDIQLLKRLLDPKKDDVMLDVGAGTGAITNILADVCDDVFAVEPNEEKLEFMKKKYPQIKGLSSKVDAIPFPDSYFTKIFAVASFHHFDNQDLALDELCRLLKPSGLLLIH
ncbi:MAG: class I SAM-dependent methyltransferase, partial [Nitrososphaerota archaeon]|nr:class I SAM-dependent methyltransferase [Nitrososphaerota archaeon]